ncbi:MAG: glycosyltransferase [Sphaerochaetaceae bacterium]|nr:glycosyltransferase [Sphaerochaetaceae bacterium]
MKVFFICKKLSEGGAERVVSNLCSAFSLRGHDTAVINCFKTDLDYPVEKGVRRFFLEEESSQNDPFLKRNLRRIRGIREILKKERPDVVISFMAESNFRTVAGTAGLGIKTIISVRNDPEKEYEGRFATALAKGLLPQADGCVFQTPDAQAYFPEKLQKKSVIIPNAVKQDFFEVKREPKEFLVTSCGRLTEQKDYRSLILAFKDLLKKVPRARLQIYGTGELEEELKELSRKEKLEKFVSFFGRSSDIPSVLSKTSLFVLSSAYEGMPNALMEALAAGVPSVSTDCPCGGPRMLIENGVNGLLVPPGDPEALSKAMEEILTHPIKAQKMGEEARKRAQEYTTDKITDRWEEYVRQVLGK